MTIVYKVSHNNEKIEITTIKDGKSITREFDAIKANGKKSEIRIETPIDNFIGFNSTVLYINTHTKKVWIRYKMKKNTKLQYKTLNKVIVEEIIEYDEPIESDDEEYEITFD